MKIFLKDEITKEVANDITFQINNTSDKEIELIINSVGGEIIQGYNIINALNNFDGETTANVQGLAASMAFIIMLSCDKLKVANHSIFMLHDPSNQSIKDDKQAEILDKFKSSLMKIINNKTNISIEKLFKLMKDETWLNVTDFKEIIK